MGLYTKIADLQKLRIAWKQVYKKRPKEGVDEISCEEFEAGRENYLKVLAMELRDHTYECQPVRLAPLYKEEKVRYISLYCMRDKVVQCSAAELANLYEPFFSKSSYAYRSGKSALHASQDICAYIKKSGECWVLQADIHSFFDCILQDYLFGELRRRIVEEDVLELLKKIICAPSLDKNGILSEKRLGLYQGSAIAPILSNIYLTDLDERIRNETRFYVRYSDDLLIFFQSREEADGYLKQMVSYFSAIGLEFNQEKTKIARLSEGFDFLGSHFDKKGISVPDKAKIHLNGRLEDIWLNSSYSDFSVRMRKALEIVNGWEQYFSVQKEFHGILEYAVWVYRMQKSGSMDLAGMKAQRLKMKNPYKDIAVYLASVWQKYHMQVESLREYEMYYNLPELWEDEQKYTDNPMVTELLEMYKKYVIQESPDISLELMQLYADLKKYKNAAVLSEKGRQTRNHPSVLPMISSALSADGKEEMRLSADGIARYMELFVGREDLYALNEMTDAGRRICREVQEPLLPELVHAHLSGEKIVSTYIQRNNATVKYLVIDLDISKGILLRQEEGIVEEYMKKCLHIAERFRKEFYHIGIKSYLEKSGGRGFHVWVFFDEWIPVRYVNMLTDLIDARVVEVWSNSGIQVEYFPNKTRLRNGKKGQCMKLPFGIHPHTGRKSCFMTETGELCWPQQDAIDNIVCYPLHVLKKTIASGYNEKTMEAARQIRQPLDRAQTAFGKAENADMDLKEFEVMHDAVRKVLEECSLMRYLCQKAKKTCYLTHYERLSILYVFGHIGAEGKEFVHKVMSFTLNYSSHVTQKFIMRCPEKPVSCIKLREQYKRISAEIGCTCRFHRTKHCYPSPVLHALQKSEENTSVTMPLRGTVSIDKQKILKNEINTASRAQEIAEKLIELRKQKQGLDKAVKKCEQELEALFDDNITDSMEIKIGLLARKKEGDKVEWRIEL